MGIISDNLTIASVDGSQSFGSVKLQGGDIVYTKSANFALPGDGQRPTDQIAYTV